MVRWAGLVLLLAAGGCAALADDGLSGPGPAGSYDFDWKLSGDAAVAPLQVFATDAQVWLQFGAGQEVPAIFAGTAQGDRLVAWRRQGPYVVLDGAWRSLTMRGGRYVARAARAGEPALGRQGVVPLGTASAPVAIVAGQAGGYGGMEPGAVGAQQAGAVDPGATAPGAAMAGAMTSEALKSSAAAPGAPMSGATASLSAPSASSQPSASSGVLSAPRPAASPAFHAGPPEATLRAVLARWAQAAGWTFQAQHWAVDVDIPLAGSAEFGSDFKQAVRALLGSTELTDRPVQPCFYTNRVLRVVPFTQACDPSAMPAGVPS
ncbi:TcpQ domain-containing protein [Bordetella genomosp. 13]|uniref:TcpQ domain-containing protein n=1 Tax=Bordetella genomosp. 13 TaxID=463040 RepID=UPI0021B54A66|nr:TcpQ domain-containing protein [Bordetella genomosp. 13]